MPKNWQNLKNITHPLTHSPTWIQEMLAHLKTVRDLKKCEGSQKVWDLKNEIFWNFEISKYEFLKNTYNLDLKSLEMLKNPLISIFGMRPRNIEVNDFVKN